MNKITSYWSGYSKGFCILVVHFIFSIQLVSQTQCPADAPNGFTIEEVGDSCYILFTWPKDEMPELNCGTPGTPAAGSSTFRGVLLNLTLDGSTTIYENGNNCNGSTFKFQYHSTFPDTYITTQSYCDITALQTVSFVANRTQGSNFTCDQTNNGPANAPMPIGLRFFKAIRGENQSVLLNWTTEWEENNEYFQIEHSQDGKNFKAISTVPGKGNSTITQQYEFQDKSPSKGLNYYRLKQIDFDGQFSYSEISSIDVLQPNKWKIYPTVTSGQLTIETPMGINNHVEIYVMDLLGQKVAYWSSSQWGENIQLNLASLSPGSYTMILQEKGSLKHCSQIIKK